MQPCALDPKKEFKILSDHFAMLYEMSVSFHFWHYCYFHEKRLSFFAILCAQHGSNLTVVYAQEILMHEKAIRFTTCALILSFTVVYGLNYNCPILMLTGSIKYFSMQ